MERAAQDRAKRAGFWPEVEAFFGDLPPDQFRQGVLLRHNLATFHADTGQFADILSRPTDPPWLDLHFWLLDDWGIPDDEARQAVERRVFLAMVAAFGAICTRESLLDAETGFDSSYQRLEQALHQECASQLAHLFAPESPFWNHHRAFRQAWDTAVTGSPDWARGAALVDDLQRRMADRLAFLKIPAVAVVLHTGEATASRLAPLLDLLDHLNAILETVRQSLSIQRDAHRGRLSYPLVRTMMEAGLAPGQPVSPERLLGALWTTGTMGKLADECLAQLETCRASALNLHLPTLAAYLPHVEDWFHELKSLFTANGSRNIRRAGQTRLTFVAARDDLAQAIAMAESYLLADRSWRESWEIQRRGMFDTTELTGRVFAPGLVLEMLCPHRADLAVEVSALLDRLAADGFRYYPHPSVPPDADDLGLALRLYAYSDESQRPKHRQQLQPPLRWMEANILEAGQIPCWFTRGVEGLSDDFPTALWGNQCATVQANLLLGLLAYDPATYRTVIARAAGQWLDRWQSSGLGANALYAPSYALWSAQKLLEALSQFSTGGDLQDEVERGQASMLARLHKEAGQVSTPQSAAHLTLAYLSGSARPPLTAPFDVGWISMMLKQQRYDGSWMAEPLFVTPTRGEVAAWYASQSVTTAYCHHALMVYERWRKTGTEA
jgi:hypothetical protein